MAWLCWDDHVHFRSYDAQTLQAMWEVLEAHLSNMMRTAYFTGIPTMSIINYSSAYFKPFNTCLDFLTAHSLIEQ